MRKVGVWAGVATLGVAVAGWLGAGVLLGQRVQAAVEALAPAQGPGPLRLLRHERGLWRSQGQLELTLAPGCVASPAPAWVMRVDYTVSHLPLPHRLASLDWKALQQERTVAAFRAVFGEVDGLAGQGRLGLGGALQAWVPVPAWTLNRAGLTLEAAPSELQVRLDGPALGLAWTLPQLLTGGRGPAWAAGGLALDVDLTDRHRGLGQLQLTADRLETGLAQLQGLSLLTRSTAQGDRLDLSITPAVRQLQLAGVELSGLEMQWALQGLDAASVHTLVPLLGQGCGAPALSPQEGRAAAAALTRLLARGLSLGVPHLGGQSAQGALAGRLMVTLAEAPGGQPALATQLRAEGRLQVGAGLMPSGQREAALQQGWAVPQGEDLTLAFEYAEGVLRLNGQVQEVSRVPALLRAVDEALREGLAQWGGRSAGAPAAAAALPEPLPEPLPLPRPASGGGADTANPP
ncbi:DUF945 family protein [Ideonella livida]|uniref:YdgA family protein n=1 Tax=Ideonella livida TaxID=2707176 RepID=A0A7C9PJH7_9BURK|nr:DUF945 family protein [Ideonella livida]NDY93536.1 YdgA family protein [Ideonella livida]